jgi:hypothetical protein
LGLLVIQVILDFVPWWARKYSSLEKTDLFGIDKLRDKIESDQASMLAKPMQSHKVLDVFFWFFTMVVSIYLFGFMIADSLYIFFYLKVRARASWLISFVITAVLLSFLYGVFVFALQTNLYGGQLTVWF